MRQDVFVNVGKRGLIAMSAVIVANRRFWAVRLAVSGHLGLVGRLRRETAVS